MDPNTLLREDAHVGEYLFLIGGLLDFLTELYCQASMCPPSEPGSCLTEVLSTADTGGRRGSEMVVQMQTCLDFS